VGDLRRRHTRGRLLPGSGAAPEPGRAIAARTTERPNGVRPVALRQGVHPTGVRRFFVDVSHSAPQVAAHLVTVSPDVASSTNLGGWINRAGVWHVGERIDWFADDTDTLVRWRESEHGQHIELGIAEGNLVGLLGELGATWSRDGQPLFPIGTLYDPFVGRALEPWSFGIYAGGQSILVGTPSGVTLARRTPTYASRGADTCSLAATACAKRPAPLH
jgi:pyruvate dehydrogenase E1 component